MRAVEWALECGLKTAEPELLEAAGTALDHFRNRSSRTMAAKIVDPALVPQAQAIQARALYNEGDYAGAAKLLDGCWLQLGSGAAAAPALMLRALVHQALGTPLAVFAAESREALRSSGAEAVPALGTKLTHKLTPVLMPVRHGLAGAAAAPSGTRRSR